MRSAQGFTLIELLVVISIISILGVMGFVNFKDFSTDQVALKGVGQIQSLLRLAQTNATSFTVCNGITATAWYLNFPNSNTIQLNCNPGGTVKTYTLQDAQIVVTGDSGCAIPFPLTVNYSTGAGTQSLVSAGALPSCLLSSFITFTVQNTKNPLASP